jgi:hypothetical protein
VEEMIARKVRELSEAERALVDKKLESSHQAADTGLFLCIHVFMYAFIHLFIYLYMFMYVETYIFRCT